MHVTYWLTTGEPNLLSHPPRPGYISCHSVPCSDMDAVRAYTRELTNEERDEVVSELEEHRRIRRRLTVVKTPAPLPLTLHTLTWCGLGGQLLDTYKFIINNVDQQPDLVSSPTD